MMKNNRERQETTNSTTQGKANPVSNSSPVQDNSSPDNDKQQGSPKGNDENSSAKNDKADR